MIYNECWCSSVDYEKFSRFRTKFFDRTSPKIEIVKCTNCGTVRMHDNALNEIPDYQQSYEYQKLSGRHFRTIEIISQNLQGTSILDVGCNTGILLSGIQEMVPGIQKLKGIDLDKQAIDIGKKKYRLDLEQKNLHEVEEKYDNIVLCHTLEHIPDLQRTFRKLNSLSNPNGKLFISVPNIKSLNARVALRMWKSLSPQYHLWYFDVHTLTKCLKEFLPEFEIIHASSYFTWAPFYYSEPVWKFMRNKTPGIVEKLESNFLGDQLDVVLRKPQNK